MAVVTVVGAGISGVACARALVDAGHRVTVLDAGRRPGGRMGARRWDSRVVDIGASYLTATDDAFRAVVDDWASRGLARPWTDTFAVHDADGWGTSSGPMRWAAPGGLNGLVRDLAEPLDVRSGIRVARVDLRDGAPHVDGERADAVVLAMPDPQAARLLGDGLDGVRARLDDPFEPVLVLTAAWPERAWRAFDGVFVNGHPLLSWVADDGRRRGDGAPVLTAHATPAFSAGHLEQPDAAAGALLAAVAELLEVDPDAATLAHVHRWTFARPSGTRSEPFLLDGAVGVCGDAWSERPSVGSAWRSGAELGAALAARLG